MRGEPSYATVVLQNSEKTRVWDLVAACFWRFFIRVNAPSYGGDGIFHGVFFGLIVISWWFLLDPVAVDGRVS